MTTIFERNDVSDIHKEGKYKYEEINEAEVYREK